MPSGNPSKASEDATVKQVRAGIRAGKSATLPLTPNTKVTISGGSEDEAEFITRVIMANMGAGTDEEFEVFLHSMELYTTLYGIYDEYRPRVVKSLRRSINALERMK